MTARRLLLVAPSAPDGVLDALAESLAEAGFEVATAPDGLYATQLLERAPAAAVLTPLRLPDMAAGELAQILAADPALAAVRRILVPLPHEPLPDTATARAFHAVMPPGTPPRQAAVLVHLALAPAPPERRDDPATAGAAPPRAADAMSGTLGAVDFAQLVQLLAESRLAGVLGVELPGGEGLVYFDRGEVVHCAWGALRGREAFREVLAAALAGPAPFHYRRLGLAEAFRVPRSLGLPVQKLLLDASVELDQAAADARRGLRGGGVGA